MAEKFDLLVLGGTCVTPDGIAVRDVGVRGGRIAAIGDLYGAVADTIFDAAGLHVLPGVIDSQVHFREPGGEHKEDLQSGSAAAVMGGVTGVFEMPNTRPATISVDAVADKLARANGRMWCNFAFYAGATGQNSDELPEMENMAGCCGVKIFMGSSTGNLLVDSDEELAGVLSAVRRRVAVHCEDEERLQARSSLAAEGMVATHPLWRDEETAINATRRLLTLARKLGRQVHVLHVTTAQEMALLAEYRDVASVEATPQHLTLVAPDCYERLGTYAQMNPPIREAHHRDALWRAIGDGIVDVIGSDHAPHTIEEKAKPYPQSPSGMPGVQTLLPLLLDHANAGRLSLLRLVDLTSAGAARIFGIAGKGRIAVGYDADLTLVDLAAQREISDDWLVSRAGWSPFLGQKITGWPMATIIGGGIVMRDGEILGDPAGKPMRFWSAAGPAG